MGVFERYESVMGPLSSSEERNSECQHLPNLKLDSGLSVQAYGLCEEGGCNSECWACVSFAVDKGLGHQYGQNTYLRLCSRGSHRTGL